MDQKGFFWRYRDLGYNNPKARYWHHGEEPHKLFADELYQFIESNKHVYRKLFQKTIPRV